MTGKTTVTLPIFPKVLEHYATNSKEPVSRLA